MQQGLPQGYPHPGMFYSLQSMMQNPQQQQQQSSQQQQQLGQMGLPQGLQQMGIQLPQGFQGAHLGMQIPVGQNMNGMMGQNPMFGFQANPFMMNPNIAALQRGMPESKSSNETSKTK
jgi:hypothetical protein